MSNVVRKGGLHGQLNPSKSMGGLRVYGLAGRDTVIGVGGASSLLSRAGPCWPEVFLDSVFTSPSRPRHEVPSLVAAAFWVSPKSTVAFLPYVLLMDDSNLSRSCALPDAGEWWLRGEPPLSRYEGTAERGLGVSGGDDWSEGIEKRYTRLGAERARLHSFILNTKEESFTADEFDRPVDLTCRNGVL
jgi:hypothetical protein